MPKRKIKEPPPDAYQEFLRAKISFDEGCGFDVEDSEINPILKPHQRAGVRWAVHGGRRALFERFGLGKTLQQLEILRLILKKLGHGRGLIICPLGVRQEFKRDAVEKLGWEWAPHFIRRTVELETWERQILLDGKSFHGIYITNYESVRDGKLDPNLFDVVTLDEAAILSGFGGVKTFREFMALFAGDRKTLDSRERSGGIKYRFVATATPSPNEYIELLAYAAFLGVGDVSGNKTRFFKRDSTKADKLTIHPHKEIEFWLWCSTWALFLSSPSDLGFDSTGYDLPELKVIKREVTVDHTKALPDKHGQGRLYRDSTHGIVEAAKEKRDTLPERLEEMKAILRANPDDHFLIWHDLEIERHAIEKAIPGITTVYGTQPLDEREKAVIDFSDGKIKYLAGKPSVAGTGCNFQYHCHKAIFLGIGFKFREFIQALHRIYRFLQGHPVEIYLIYAESERTVLKTLERKWAQHNEMVKKMSDIIKEYGLSIEAMTRELKRGFGVQRIEVKGENYTLVNEDSILETRRMPENSVHLILTSIPFSSQYEYSPNFADLGHCDNNEHFFQQMDFLSPELLRVLIPGRMAAIHVKDRIVPSGMTGLGQQVVYPFHAKCIEHYTKHGFAYMGMKTIVTDVVRENNQTYRLGWTEQCKDGTKMGVGMPEYLLLFRKPPTDTSNSYGDTPVVKSKPMVEGGDGPEVWSGRNERRAIVQNSGYSRSRWQIDAHGFERSAGNRLLDPEELKGLSHRQIFRMFRQFSLEEVYNFEHHVLIGEELERLGKLPVTFMLLQPQSWHPDVWTDITRMLTLNGAQSAKGKEMHLCLAKGSLVLTQAGYRPIETIVAGDNVLTHQGRWRPVLISRGTGIQKTVRVSGQGIPGLTLTPDHELWMRRSSGYARERARAESANPEWVEAQHSHKNYANLKVPPTQQPSVTDSHYWWVVGRWLADGHWSSRDSAVISCGYHEIDTLSQQLGKFGGNQWSDVGTGAQIILKDSGRILRTILDECGNGAAGKHLPPEAYGLPSILAKSLLDGYFSGDGNLVESRKRYQATSVSRALLLGIAILMQRAYSAIASVYPGRKARSSRICGRIVNCQQEWIFSCDMPDIERRKKPFFLEDGAWKRIRKVEPSGEIETWNLRVEEDESFIAEGCVVKNCPMQLDLADRVIAQLSMPGETVLDPFSGLGTVPYRAIKFDRKGYGIELSHSYFLDSVSYCAAAEREKAMPTLFDLIEKGDSESEDAIPAELESEAS
jgi:hypothetical protein